MHLPFSVEQFYAVFRAYNEAVWPAQVLLLALAVTGFVLVFRPRPWTGATIAGVLGFLWAWQALAYHLTFFSRINPLAYVFSIASLLAALVFLWQGVVRRRLHFSWQGGMRSVGGAALVVMALGVYPVWSWYAGHSYPQMPTFGLPCPTTLFTIGMLGFLAPSDPRSPIVIPLVWTIVGGQAALFLGVPQDVSLFVAGAYAIALLARPKGWRIAAFLKESRETAQHWARWGLAWLPMVPIAIANGALRDLGYGPALGALRAHQVSTLTAIALFGVYIWFALRWLAPGSLAVAARGGGLWLCMTVLFEFGFGHYVAGQSWAALVGNYDLLAGRLWPLILLWVMFAPPLFYRLQRR